MAFSTKQEEIAVPKSTRPPFDPKRLSQEQLDIIHCDAQVIVGQAFAGTGKSTTGLGYTALHPDKKILVVY